MKNVIRKKVIATVLCAIMVCTASSTGFAEGVFYDNNQISVSAAISTSQNLKIGSKGLSVKQLQMNLNVLNYSCGTADGVYGNNTKQAVKKFQRAFNLEQDGIAGKDTITWVNRLATYIQTRLNQLGYNCGWVDGVMGSNTVAQIKRFQRDRGLEADGCVGNMTLNELKKNVTVTQPQKTSSSSLNITSAKNYCSKYAYNYNPAYPKYSGRDCANFVSQILVASGLSTNSQFKAGSLAFINVKSQRSYLVKQYGVKYIDNPKSSQIAPGDLIWTGSYGSHVMFVESVNNGVIRCSAHTNNRLHASVGISAICCVVKTSALYS